MVARKRARAWLTAAARYTPLLPARLVSSSRRPPRSLRVALFDESPRMGGGSKPPRGDYATLAPSDLAFFRRALDADGVRVDARSLAEANEDWMRKYEGSSRVLLLPRTTQQVSLILRHCNDRRLAVVPQGGNTGLVGGGVPVHDEVILGTRRMNRVLRVDPSAGVVVAEAGVVLENLETALNAHGMTVPLDLGAKGKCQIGGNVSTNAGGLRLLRHGSLHGSVLGVEVALADGSILDLLSVARKDNTGYDLKQLFIGAEGTLGVVTKVALLAPRLPARVDVAFVAAPDFASCVAMLRDARSRLGDVLHAFEFMDRASLELVVATLKGARDPLPRTPAPFYVLVETAAFQGDGARERARLRDFVVRARREKIAVAGTVGRDAKESARLWNLRERVSLALKRAGATYKYDLSLPTEEMYDLVDETRARLVRAASLAVSKSSVIRDARVLGYGHLGDGNLHLNVSSPAGYDAALERVLEPFVYEWTAARRGSVSAEHGVGAMKSGELRHSKPPEAVALMRGIKRLMDPKGILNPYKVLPPEEGVVVRDGDGEGERDGDGEGRGGGREEGRGEGRASPREGRSSGGGGAPRARL